MGALAEKLKEVGFNRAEMEHYPSVLRFVKAGGTLQQQIDLWWKAHEEVNESGGDQSLPALRSHTQSIHSPMGFGRYLARSTAEKKADIDARRRSSTMVLQKLYGVEWLTTSFGRLKSLKRLSALDTFIFDKLIAAQPPHASDTDTPSMYGMGEKELEEIVREGRKTTCS